MVLDLIFRLFLALTAVTGCALFFKVKASWLKQCHLTLGVLTVVFCFITFFMK